MFGWYLERPRRKERVEERNAERGEERSGEEERRADER